ncbi:MAG: phage holin family protein [Chitinophagaceae bacterium]
MEDLKEKTIDLADHVEELADTFYRLTVVNLTQKVTNLVSGAVVMLVLCLLGFFVLIFAGCGLAWWLGNLVNSRIGGFLLAAAFFLVVMIIISLLKQKTIFPFIRNLIIRKVYD